MKPAEKIKLIKSISKNLLDEDWSIIDLTLKEYKFPTTDVYSGNKESYLIEHLQKGDEDNISELYDSLFPTDVEDITISIPRFWKDGYFKLFISHLATDKVQTKKLKTILENYGISGFVAHTDIEPTKEWQEEIEKALRTCDSLVALMVDGFHESKWTDQEIGFALGRDLLIIPIRMGQDPYGFIGKYQAIRFTDIESLAKEIFNTLQKSKKTSKKIAYSTIYKFENSDSFASAKANIELVKENIYWDRKLKERLEKSLVYNSQIKQSFGVPEKIKDIISNIKTD